ncbi:Signal recognition particle core component [Arachnomyces sp. PD_36]|nr:Signal recognition particle core component [Arachnomyces sp. PD_36]
MAQTTKSLSALLQRATIDDDEEVLQTCNSVLAKSKGDLEAQHVKVIALLNLDRFEDALRVIEEGGDTLKGRASLEWAYALYKVGRLEEAVDVAAKSAAGRGAKHVEAQASYRAEDFLRSASIYKAFFADKASLGPEENDLRINARAADAQLQWKGQTFAVQSKRPSREDLEAFETAYNVACGSISRGELSQGELLLKRAAELCRSSDDLSPEDKEAELLPIAVQQLYVLLRLGKLDEAKAVAEKIGVEDISELSTKKIAQNNLLLVQNQSNPYLLHKQFHDTPQSTDSDKLFDYQERALDGNSHSIDLLVRKYDGVARLTAKTLSESPAPTTSAKVNMLSVFNAAAHAREEIGKPGLKKILPLLEKRPQDVGLVLTIIQLYVTAGDLSSAISTLESFLKQVESSDSPSDQDVRFNPGLISVLIALYKKQGRKTHIKTELSKAASHWRNQPQQKQPASLLRAAATSLLESPSPNTSDATTAAEIFSSLHEQDPTDKFATAGYVAAHATTATTSTSLANLKPKVQNLTPIQDLISGIDVSALENAGIPHPAALAPSSSSTGKRRAEESKDSNKKKRARKTRLPKDYDPNSTKGPDPERWLPMRDRSYYRPRGKKGKQKAADRTQGGVVNEEAVASDGGAGAGVVKASGGGGGGGGKKKKGKGKR